MNPSPRIAAAHIASRLTTEGHIAYFAGGCVRDELLGLAPKDYDIATDATPDRIRSLFKKTAHVGAAFGVVLVRELGFTIEVATFRADGPYSDRRRPDHVTFSSPQADAHRRDFTINALFLDPAAPPDRARQHVIDHVGGLEDLDNRLIRAVGNPDQRLAEDHLRAIRAIRFAARYTFDIHPQTRDALTRHATALVGISRERIGEEIRRILLHPSRTHAIHLLSSTTLDSPVLNEPASNLPTPLVESLPPQAPLAAILAAWALDRHPDLPDPDPLARQWRSALVLSNDEHAALQRLLALRQHLISDWPTSTTPQRKRWAADPLFQWSIRLLATNPPLQAARSDDLATLASTPSGIAPTPLITGDTLIGWGFSPSSHFRTLIDHLYDLQLEDRITTIAQAKAKVMELAADLGIKPH